MLKGEDRLESRTVRIGSEEVNIGMVADGHGGKEAAVHCRRRVLDVFLESSATIVAERFNGKADAKALREALRIAFATVHEEVKHRIPH